MDGDFPLTVLISDPSAKKKRTDEESTKATLFVGGLNAMTTEGEVRKLLSSVRFGVWFGFPLTASMGTL